MSIRKIIAGVAGLVLVTGGALTAVTASASGPGAGECNVVQGSVAITSGGGILQAPATTNDTFQFVDLAISCTSSDGDDTGTWAVQASGHGDNENCASGTGGGTIDGGSGPEGSITGGTFSFTRVGSHVHVTGNILTADDNHSFTAEFEFVPSNGDCIGQAGPTTQATLTGAAAVTE